MLRKWMCLILAMALCLAPLAVAVSEEIVISDDEALEKMPAELAANASLADAELSTLDSGDESPLEGTLADDALIPAPVDETAGEDEAQQETAGEETSDEAAVAQEPSIVLSATSLTIGIKEQCKALTAKLSPEGSRETVTWTSSKPKIAKVNKKTGAITGVKAGATVITATTPSGLTASCKVTVAKAPDKVTLTETAITLCVGATHVLKATLPARTGSTLTFATKSAKVATVEAYSGVITAVAPGSTTITVKTFNGKKATCKVTVVAEPDQVTLPAKLTIARREHRTVTPGVLDKDGNKSAATFTFSARNGTGKITVDPKTGEVEGVSVGTATLRVSTHNGVTSHLVGGKRVETVCKVTVVEGPEAVSLAAESLTIGLKQTYALAPVILGADGKEMSGAKYTVTSSAPKKLSVTSKGVVKGLAKGTYSVTVTAYNGVQATCAVRVVDAPSKVTLSPKKPVLGLGQTAKLKVNFPSGSMGSCTFSSSNKKVATVDNEGNVTGIKVGSAVIKARTHNGRSASVTVTVTKGPGFLSLNGTYELVYDALTDSYRVVYTKTLEMGKTFQITYENEYGTYGSISSYKSDNTDVATVSGKGLVTAVEPGTANIVIRSTSGAEATLAVTVPGTPPAKIAFGASEMGVQVGKTVDVPTLRGSNIEAAALEQARFESSDTFIFTVAFSDEENRCMLTGVNPGKAKLTATAGGAKAQLQVTVSEASEIRSIAFADSLVYMKVGERYVPVVLDDDSRLVAAVLSSSAPEVVSANGEGVLTALAEGSATITAAYGDYSASMTVKVRAGDATVTLGVDSVQLGVGQRYSLKARVNGDGSSSKLTYASSNTAVASVTSAGVIIARSAGSATVTVTEAGGASASCAVTVSPAPSRLVLEPASISAMLNTGGAQLKWSFGASSEVGTVSFASSDEKVATVNEEGYVAFKAVGTATVTAVTNNGLTAAVDVTVLPNRKTTDGVTYRLFAAYSYHDELPFTKRNVTALTNVFGKSKFGEKTYSIKTMGNPSKTQLFSGISSFFSNTDDDDVSIVYLCSHGHNNTSTYSNYRMSLPGYANNMSDPNYYMTSKEIFNCVRRIRGDVVLIIDSCFSGTFIEDMKARLDAEGGRIAVLTAASNTRATFYNVKKNSVDFFTFFLLMGLGYNEREGWWNGNAKGGKGSYPGYLAADLTGNGDGIVTLSEAFNYASKCIAVNIPSYMSQSWYWGDKTKVQSPRFYVGNLKNLAIYQPK